MDSSIIPHVFASLLSLERQIERVTTLSKDDRSGSSVQLRRFLPEQRRVIDHMRRIANSLQLSLAADDVGAAIRALRIFYGLNHMVRPELTASLISLNRPSHSGALSKRPSAEPTPLSQLH